MIFLKMITIMMAETTYQTYIPWWKCCFLFLLLYFSYFLFYLICFDEWWGLCNISKVCVKATWQLLDRNMATPCFVPSVGLNFSQSLSLLLLPGWFISSIPHLVKYFLASMSLEGTRRLKEKKKKRQKNYGLQICI